MIVVKRMRFSVIPVQHHTVANNIFTVECTKLFSIALWELAHGILLKVSQFSFPGNTVQESTGQQYDNKTGQWFGSLVTSSGEDGVVLVRDSQLRTHFIKR